MSFHWSDSKSPQVPKILQSIPTDFNSTVGWLVSILPLMFGSSSLFSRSLATVSRAPTTSGTTVTFMFHSFLVRYEYLFIFPFSSILILLYSRNTNISGNIIKHNLRTSMNERTHFFIKIYLSHFILERVYVSVVRERWVERHILRERTSSSHIFF